MHSTPLPPRPPRRLLLLLPSTRGHLPLPLKLLTLLPRPLLPRRALPPHLRSRYSL